MLAISPRGVENLRASGVLPSIKLGRSRRYVMTDVERFIEQQRQDRYVPLSSPKTPNGARESAARPKTAGGLEPPRHAGS